jgi:hypothetical protein
MSIGAKWLKYWLSAYQPKSGYISLHLLFVSAGVKKASIGKALLRGKRHFESSQHKMVLSCHSGTCNTA